MSAKGIALFSSAALCLAACSRPQSMDDQMRKDLEAASAATFELAPAAAGQKVVSAIEQTGRPQQKAPSARTETNATGRTESPQRKPDSSSRATEPAATRPLPASSVSAPPPGGYKTMDEVLRKAPFPIKP